MEVHHVESLHRARLVAHARKEKAVGLPHSAEHHLVPAVGRTYYFRGLAQHEGVVRGQFFGRELALQVYLVHNLPVRHAPGIALRHVRHIFAVCVHILPAPALAGRSHDDRQQLHARRVATLEHGVEHSVVGLVLSVRKNRGKIEVRAYCGRPGAERVGYVIVAEVHAAARDVRANAVGVAQHR